jgi:ribosomal protein S12 methylthiotransferase accessory factor
MQLSNCSKLAHGKCETPEDTIARLDKALSAVHKYECVPQQVSEHLHWVALFIPEINFQSMGKGISATLATASAMAEAAERLAIRDCTRLPGYVCGNEKNIANPLRIADLLSHVSTATPDVVEKIVATDLAQHWVDACSLLTGDQMKVPIQYIHGISGSNGLASGNRMEEAIVQATHEVFERRAAITALKNKMVLPTIDLETIANPVIREQISFIRSHNIDVYIKDLSFGGVLPCVGIYLVDNNVPAEFQAHHLFKAAASYDSDLAIMRTLTEFAQGRRFDDSEQTLTKGFERLKCEGDAPSHFLTSFKFGYVSYDDPSFMTQGDLVPFEKKDAGSDCMADIERNKDICRQLDKDYIVVDATDPAIGFPVAQVIIPGYSDILPYHPATSRVLFDGWSRDETVGYYDETPAEI